MATSITNPSVETTSLPAPLQGALKGGETIILSYSVSELATNVPSLSRAFRVVDIGSVSSDQYQDATYGYLPGEGGSAESITVEDATTNAASTVLTLAHNTSGTPAANIGVRQLLRTENAAGTATTAGALVGQLSVVTATSEEGEVALLPSYAGTLHTAGFKVHGQVAAGVVGVELITGATGVYAQVAPYGETNAGMRLRGKGTGSVQLTAPNGSTVLVEANATGIGFYGVTPVARQLFATGASHTVDELITVLQNLGLLRQS